MQLLKKLFGHKSGVFALSDFSVHLVSQFFVFVEVVVGVECLLIDSFLQGQELQFVQLDVVSLFGASPAQLVTVGVEILVQHLYVNSGDVFGLS